MNLPRPLRRRLQRLTNEIDKLIDTDRNFFLRRPDRSYRIRRAFRQEIEANALVGEIPTQPGAGLAYFVLVRQIAPGNRLRCFIQGPADADTDIPEAAVRELYEAKVRTLPNARRVEQALEAAFREGERT